MSDDAKSEMTTRLVLVRHGQTAYNAEVRFMGQLDVPLDEIGRIQAQAVARRLSGERPAAMYSSGLSRAFDTASAIQSAIPSHPELRIDGRLTEGHFGVWQGKTYDSLKINDAQRLQEWETDRLNAAPPEGESLGEIAKRVQAAKQSRHNPRETISPGKPFEHAVLNPHHFNRSRQACKGAAQNQRQPFSIEILRAGRQNKGRQRSLQGKEGCGRSIDPKGDTGCAEALLRRFRDAPVLKEDSRLDVFPHYLEVIVRESYRCKGIIDNLLSFGRKSDGTAVRVDMNMVLLEILGLLRHQPSFRQIAVLTNSQSDLPPVLGDPSGLRQVCMNLLVNAHQAIKGNGLVTVTTTYTDDAMIAIRIGDTGSGIAQDTIDRIWDPFFTTKEVGKGGGLGLALTQRRPGHHQHGAEEEDGPDDQGLGAAGEEVPECDPEQDPDLADGGHGGS